MQYLIYQALYQDIFIPLYNAIYIHLTSIPTIHFKIHLKREFWEIRDMFLVGMFVVFNTGVALNSIHMMPGNILAEI